MTASPRAILAYLSTGPKAMRELEAHFQVTSTTIHRWLKPLFQAGQIKRIGVSRNNKQSKWALMEEPHAEP